ncbi:LysR family transcriptional regulator [Galactobacter caseinivorans]|uniref:LysR family transcriptional regulator n=1 Tax=Galactobacter caseinivorans TaxID=2676123 RepID=A0A496PI46_9MICC|nr:LysR family transcriptional regulator [Galactobacter caseinivorans]RKW70161.1 LysR family transcriptional regulator [Galactobacter caseinivorans]
MLDLHRLRLLRELALRGTVGAVAEALNYAPSTVSAQLSRLEKEAGTELLAHAGRGVRLTPAAQVLVAHAEELLNGMERAEAALAASQSEVTGTVRLSMFQTAALALLPGTLRRLRDEHPQLRVEMTQREPERALRETWARDFDLVVAEHYPEHATEILPDMEHTPLVQDPLRLAVPPDEDGPFSLLRSLSDAALVPWVLEPAPAASRHWTLQQCRQAGFEPDVRYESADLQAHLQLIESGLAVAIVPGILGGYRAPNVRWIDLDRGPHRQIFTALRLSTVHHPAAQAVRRALQDEARRLQGPRG